MEFLIYNHIKHIIGVPTHRNFYKPHNLPIHYALYMHKDSCQLILAYILTTYENISVSVRQWCVYNVVYFKKIN